MSALLQPKTMTADSYLLISTTDTCHPHGRKKGQLDSGLAKCTRVLKRASTRHDQNDDDNNENPRKKSRTALTWLNLNSPREDKWSPLLTMESMMTSPSALDVSLEASSAEQHGLSTAGENSPEDRTRENTNFAFETNLVNIILERPPSLRRIRESDEESDGSLSDEDSGLDEPFRIVG